ncbi:MAG: GTP cyclohydrolase II [Myxococcales bacterium]|nr:GTP cyclohydrolase II [Myxococcales bacterium]
MNATPSHQRIEAVRTRVNAAVQALCAGKVACVVEDAGASSAVWAVMIGHGMTADRMNHLVSAAGGIISTTVGDTRADALRLAEIPPRRTTPDTPRYAVSVEAAEGVSTGISALDRALTVAALCNPSTDHDDLLRPGHVMPIRVAQMGCLKRPYGPEAAHDLMAIAGQQGGAALAHVISGVSELSAADAPDFAAERGWPVVYVSDVMLLRSVDEQLVQIVREGEVPAEDGNFRVQVWRTVLDGGAHVALARGELCGQTAPLVRVHSQCLTGDILHSHRCDCGVQLHEALRRIDDEACGALIYLSQEGRGIGLVGKIKAYDLQDAGMDTVDANLELGFPVDQRDYAAAAQVLRTMGIRRVRLMTNNPEKVTAMERLGIEVVERVSLVLPQTEHNQRYLATKRDRLGHML